MVDFDRARKMLERGTIEVAPLAFMRGRTLNDSFVILDEAQNTTREQMKMFLTRLGYGSKAVITGDVTQIDLPAGQAVGPEGGAARSCADIDGIRFCTSPSATSCATRWCRRSSPPTTAPTEPARRPVDVVATPGPPRRRALAARVGRARAAAARALRLPDGRALAAAGRRSRRCARLNRAVARARTARPTCSPSRSARAPGGAPDGLLGDVVISVDTARRQAAERGGAARRARSTGC